MILSKNSSRIKMPCCMYIYHFFFKCVHVTDTKTQSRRLSAIDESAFFLSRDVDKKRLFKDVCRLLELQTFYPQMRKN